MALISNERTKLFATYLNGLAIAAAAVGGIGQAVAAWSGAVVSGIPIIATWFLISLTLHIVGQLALGRLRE